MNAIMGAARDDPGVWRVRAVSRYTKNDATPGGAKDNIGGEKSPYTRPFRL